MKDPSDLKVPAIQDPEVRAAIVINPDAQVRIVFEGYDRIPVFECDPCEELLLWSSSEAWWECPSCGYQMTPLEAEELLALARRRIDVVLTDVQKKQGIGRWRRTWRRLGRRFSEWSRRSSKKSVESNRLLPKGG